MGLDQVILDKVGLLNMKKKKTDRIYKYNMNTQVWVINLISSISIECSTCIHHRF